MGFYCIDCNKWIKESKKRHIELKHTNFKIEITDLK